MRYVKKINDLWRYTVKCSEIRGRYTADEVDRVNVCTADTLNIMNTLAIIPSHCHFLFLKLIYAFSLILEHLIFDV